MMLSRLIPLIFFVMLAVMLAFALQKGKPPAPAALLDRPAPATAIEGIDDAALRQGWVVVNFFASWCAPCAEEQPLLLALGRQTQVAVLGIAYKDKTEDTARFLETYGNPFTAIGRDAAGRAALDWGVYGVPETYLLHNGVIRWRHAGALSEDILARDVLPRIQAGGAP